MNGYADMTAAEHESTAEYWAEFADLARAGRQPCNFLYTLRELIRVCQNLAVMHYEDAQRIRNTR